MNNQTFETADLNLATLIYYEGFNLVSIDRQNERSRFIFNATKELNQLIQQYWNGQLLVEPKSYFNSLREIKVRLRS